MPALNKPRTGNLCDLITSQINFGLAYVEEARNAYCQGRFEYGDLARQIALNACSTASRFAARLPERQDPVLLDQVARFKQEVDALLEEPVAVRSIA
jgi:hypothetical protein